MAESAVPEVPGFTVGRELGRGGSSVVWLVTEDRTGTNFALKCFLPRPASAKKLDAAVPDGLEPDLEPGTSAESDVRREIRILSTLDHQHLIKAHDVVRLAGGSRHGLGLLVDYAPGGSLAQLVASRGNLSVGETVTVLTPIAQVLGYLHAQGLTHSDVSPGNVLFSSHGKPLLADVGIARMVGDAAAVAGHGTQGFMDPAPVDAVRAGLQPERDVYGVAALGWYCLTGEAPATTPDRPPLPLLLPGVPAELAAALESGLNDDRRRRPTAVELAAAIYRSAEPLPVDLAGSVHSTVIPELLTRRPLPARSVSGVREVLAAWRRRMATSGWAGTRGGRHATEREATPPAPLPVTSSAASRPAESRRGTAGRRRAVFLAALLAVVAAACWLVGPGGPVPIGPDHVQAGPGDVGSDESIPATVNPASAVIPENVAAQLASSDPGVAVHGLAGLRSLAFSSGQLDLLARVNVGGSTASAADEAISAPLRASGHVLAGFAGTLSEVRVQPESTADRAVVVVTSAASSFEERDRSGAVVATGAAAAARELQLVLVSVEGTWRITDILPN